MKICYIIGPIRSKWGLIGRLINVWRGRQAAVKLWNAGFAVICPHLNSFAIAISGVDEDEIVKFDCEIIQRCDFVVILKRWTRSKGAQIEVDYCYRIGKNKYWDVNSAVYCEKSQKETLYQV